jgi:hypothetical protein
MLKRFIHSLAAAAALLFTLTATSALASQGVRPARSHAARHAVRVAARHHSKAHSSHRSKEARRHARRRHEVAVREADLRRRTSRKLPAKPVWPVAPVSPIEPTPPLQPTPPTEPPPTEPVVQVTPAPTVTAMPAVAGVTSQGQTLHATTGTWTGNPTGYAYQWRDCKASGGRCANVAGAAASSYKLAAGDVGQKMSVTVTATNSGGSSSANSPMTATVKAPAPTAPTNTTVPAIAGTATEGETLSATAGTWSGEPTTYSYQWQDCTVAGASCSSIAGATSSSYALTAGDVGHTVRIVVSASNAGGLASAPSAPTATVAAVSSPPPAPPIARFTYSPSSPVTGQAVAFDGSSSSCAAGPCTYEWSDDGAATRPIAVLWPLGGGQVLSFAFSEAGTKYVRLIVTDATGQTATAEHNVVVGESPPPSPVTPSDTAAPILSGTPEVGQTLSASNGAWTGSPTSYAYQWQDCDTSGESCSNIGGATSSSYKLTAGDLAHTVRVVVSASNAGGSASAGSAVTSVVTAVAPPVAPPELPTNSSLPTIGGTATEGQTLTAREGTWTGSPTAIAYQWQRCNSAGGSCTNVVGALANSYGLSASDVGSTLRVLVAATNGAGTTTATSAQTAAVAARVAQQTDCFNAPGACGYPDPNYSNVGPSTSCSSLTPSGALTVSTAGATVQNMNITGKVTIAANNVTLTNDCISVNGKAELGTNAVAITGGKSGTLISHSDISGATATTQSVEEALNNNGGSSNTTADHDYIFNCGECVHGTWTLTNSYVTSNATISTDHYEDIYCNDTTFVAEHDVLINPHEQTANLFCDTHDGSGGAADDHITLTGSLLAGSGYSIYPQGNSSSVGSSTTNIANNRVARCLTSHVYNKSSGGTDCSGGTDAYGLYPFGGQYGVIAYNYCPPTSVQIWSNNVWDNNSETITCE